MPIGTLKYKQDDGSIVELKPAGYVDTDTYATEQAMQNTSIAAAQAAVDKLESAHSFASIEEAIKSEGYLNIVEAIAPFNFTAATASSSGTVEFTSNITLRVRLHPGTVIKDTTTIPTKAIHVIPAFAYRTSATNYDTYSTGHTWKIENVTYISRLSTIILTIRPDATLSLTDIMAGETPLFWYFVAFYI